MILYRTKKTLEYHGFFELVFLAQQQSIYVFSSLFHFCLTCEGRNNVLSGWRASGIADAVRLGLSKLSFIDPFDDIDAMMEVPNTDDNIRSVCDLTAHEVGIGYSRDDSNSEDEENYQWQCDDREADDVFKEFNDEEDL